ncbi:hypothetical protein RvY_16971 [Ramazzottius varieornatus]|uniref:Uncharacterized protein n=1 Tax=Ramazzottius varieornatus TaxID=947166 RepID=A0A1D1W6N2_RAMVA|nr:hypothetical protein RvY_16971 [Ramazzottius varieornatus]
MSQIQSHNMLLLDKNSLLPGNLAIMENSIKQWRGPLPGISAIMTTGSHNLFASAVNYQ